eukprot:5756074-Amphidinium_carterae.1
MQTVPQSLVPLIGYLVRIQDFGSETYAESTRMMARSVPPLAVLARRRSWSEHLTDLQNGRHSTQSLLPVYPSAASAGGMVDVDLQQI